MESDTEAQQDFMAKQEKHDGMIINEASKPEYA